MQVLKELERYINQTLGILVETNRWVDTDALPFFLKDMYDFFLIRLEGQDYLLMADVQEEESAPSVVRKHMDQVRNIWLHEIIYVRDQVSASNRNRLIHNRIPFVVPGNQLYLPMLAMDLRERFLAERKPVKKLGPAAQTVVLQALYRRRRLFDESLTLTQWGQEVGYTKMSMTRAFRDLRTVLDGGGLTQDLCGRALWNRVSPFMKSPVRKRRYYIAAEFGEDGYLLAGDSALAHYTMMADPGRKTVCMDSEGWKVFQEHQNLIELERPEPGALEVQIWSYSPAFFAQQGFADPLSVWLSYGTNRDERIEMALDELLEGVSW
jgi:hypothetical protein